MTEAGQSGLSEFATTADDADAQARPDEEAAHVAGNGGSSAAEVIDVLEETLPEAQGELELAVMQVDYTIAGYGDEERPIMHVFGRTAENELEHVQVVGFRPYFYAPTETLERPPEDQYDRLTDSETEDENGDSYESIRGEDLTKIFGQTPRDVGQIRDDFEHYEADILFPNRFLIDKDIQSGIRVPERRANDDSLVVPHTEVEAVDVDADPRVLTFDIEVEDRHGFPEDGEEPIVCLTSHDSYRDEYVMWVCAAERGNGEIPAEITDYEPIEGAIDHEVRAFDAEEAMLEAFVDYVRETDPDVMTGWNFEDFDAPYFLDRLEELQGPHHDYDLEIDRLSRIDEVWRSNWGGPDIKGRVSSTCCMATSEWCSPNSTRTDSTLSARPNSASARSATPATSVISGRTIRHNCSSTTSGTSNSVSNSTASNTSSRSGMRCARSSAANSRTRRRRAMRWTCTSCIRPTASSRCLEGPAGSGRGVRGRGRLRADYGRQRKRHCPRPEVAVPDVYDDDQRVARDES